MLNMLVWTGYLKITYEIGEHQGQRRSESSRLPPVCPGPYFQTQRHKRVEFVVSSLLCSERFFVGVLRFSPLLKNHHFQIPIRSWNARTLLNESCNSLVLRG